MRELRIDTRGHRAHRSGYEYVTDENYTDQWGGHSYGIQWTKITGQFSVDTYKEDGRVFLMPFGLPYSCAVCDEFMSYNLVGEVAVAKTECQYQNGMTTVVEIDVLSGRLICDDDLRDAEVFDVDIDAGADYNSMLGQAQVVEASAKVGLAYAPSGNTSPMLFEVEPGKYVVANPDYDDETDERINAPGKVVGSFCTDLWACSMADYDTYLAAGGKPIEEEDQNGTRFVIDVPPGRYRMTYHGGEAGFDFHAAGEVRFAEFEKVA